MDAISSVLGSLAGVVVGYALHWLNEKRSRARLEFDNELYFEPFKDSVRVSARIKHAGGKLPATNVIGLLTVETHSIQLSELAVGKENSECRFKNLCKKCGGRTYLASEKAEVKDEPLPWSIPINAGSGLNGIRYAHLTHIPLGGSSLLRLFDVYRAKLYGVSVHGEPQELKDEFWLVKIHSEYGVESYPRICLRIPVKRSNIELHLVIRVAGENVKEVVQDEVILKSENGDCIVEHHGRLHFLHRYFKAMNVKPLKMSHKILIR